MSSLYTTKQAGVLGAKLRVTVADSTLIRVMGGCFYFSGLRHALENAVYVELLRRGHVPN